MVDVHRYHEISESTHRIMNPCSFDKVMLLGEICRLDASDRILDLACGKGEMLCQFASRHGCSGTGVDIYPPLLDCASARAAELGVSDRVEFVEADASKPLGASPATVVSCIGATWIGGDLAGALELMKGYAEPGAWLLVGEVYWIKPPPPALAERYGQSFPDLVGVLDIFERAGVELVEMVLSSQDDWDRYATSQWLNVADWLLANPDDPDADGMRAERDESRRLYLTQMRGTLGWGVFVGRLPR